jgi:tetratricopeptide (TPR) repeat protein
MTVGMPGAAIGGLFYLFSALAMPVREAFRAIRGSRRPEAGERPARWGPALRQAGIALGILVTMWATGWLLSLGLEHQISASHIFIAPGAGRGPGPESLRNALRVAALALSLGTLASVLASVQFLRWTVGRRSRRGVVLVLSPPAVEEIGPARERSAGGRRASLDPAASAAEEPHTSARGTRTLVATLHVVALLAIGSCILALPASCAWGAATTAEGVHLARADSAYAAGASALAEREYAAVVEANSEQTHALYRLAELRWRDPKRSLWLLWRYVKLEPEDAWGWMALGEAYARVGHDEQARACYDEALTRVPQERDAVVGRARLLARAGRSDAAIAAYECWLEAHPQDAEAWNDLGRERQKSGRAPGAVRAFERSAAQQPDPRTESRLAAARRLAGPALEPSFGGSWDSDQHSLLHAGVAVDFAAADRLRLGVSGVRTHASDPGLQRDVDALALDARWRPRATLQLEARPGLARVEAAPGVQAADAVPTVHVRTRWRAPRGRAAAELRFDRDLVAVSPLLVSNHVVRDEVGAQFELPLAGPLRLRGVGRFATLDASFESNRRRVLQGGLVLRASPSLELSTTYQHLAYDHPSDAGYFAPREVQLVEAGSYAELDDLGRWSLALDLGAGAQRTTAFGVPPDRWQPAVRLWAQIAFALASGRALRLECEGYHAQLGFESASSSGWSYGFAAASLRWAIP